jgi:hypothetical protein
LTEADARALADFLNAALPAERNSTEVPLAREREPSET